MATAKDYHKSTSATWQASRVKEYLDFVHVRVLHEGESFVAQCLEYDITGHGKTCLDALENFRRTIIGQIALDRVHGKTPLQDTPCAPMFHWLEIEKDNFAAVRIDEPEFVIRPEPAI